MDLFGYNSTTKSWEFIIKINDKVTTELTDLHVKNLSVLYPEYSDFCLTGW